MFSAARAGAVDRIALSRGDGPLTQMPCFISIKNEIIELRERKRACAQTLHARPSG
jgi:hypothetical protein